MAQRTAELATARLHQAAAAEVLQVIGRSVDDPRPVFDAILAGCERLLQPGGVADLGIDLFSDDGFAHPVALRGRHRAQWAAIGAVELPPGWTDPDNLDLDQMRFIADSSQDPRHSAWARQIGSGDYSFLAVPLVWQGRRRASLFVTRMPPAPFTEREREMLKSFAAQAVIAIRNTQLFEETRQALELQTANVEVLRAIGHSNGDVAPMFETILSSFERLAQPWGALDIGISLFEADGTALTVASHGPHAAQVIGTRVKPPASWVDPDNLDADDVRYVHEAYAEPEHAKNVRERGIANYSMIAVPLIWGRRRRGSLWFVRVPPRPFDPHQTKLLRAFAAQAVMALQTTGLMRSLEDKSQQLERASRHKSEFLAQMSHELRTPLNAVIGFSEALIEQMFGAVNDKQLEYLHDIHSSGHHLLQLINDILDLSKIEAGRMELELGVVDLPGLCERALALVRERAQRQGLRLTLNVAADLDDWVADERKLMQVLLNLLSNAVKFTPEGGAVRVDLRRSIDAAGLQAAEIAVADTGVGIAAGEQEAVFETFQQARGDYLRKSEGSGLGLALAKNLVELHGGTLVLRSTPGQGSTFTVTLPRHDPRGAT